MLQKFVLVIKFLEFISDAGKIELVAARRKRRKKRKTRTKRRGRRRRRRRIERLPNKDRIVFYISASSRFLIFLFDLLLFMDTPNSGPASRLREGGREGEKGEKMQRRGIEEEREREL